MSYLLGFTAGALLHIESTKVINSIENFDDFFNDNVVLDINVLITNAETSRRRLILEIDKRLKTLNSNYLEFYLTSNNEDQKIILFLSICKLYNIIAEFALEVVYNKWKNFDNELSTYDFKYFLSSKLSEEQLNSISAHSLYKLSQVAVKMFKDVGIFKDDKLSAIHISDELVDILKMKGDAWFLPCILNPNIEED